jgi:hypothetical protein
MPLAGTLAWVAIGIAGLFAPVKLAAWVLFIATGSIFGLGVFILRFVGEDLLGRDKPPNDFDRLFLISVLMASLVWAIATPFFMIEPTLLPLSVVILSGMTWLPFSWIIQHWIGLFHGVARTLLILIGWYLFPAHRFSVITAIIVALYLISIYALGERPIRSEPAPTPS